MAKPTVAEIRLAIQSLKKFPNRGRKGREEGSRELILGRLPQIIVYRIHEDTVEILHVRHPALGR